MRAAGTALALASLIATADAGGFFVGENGAQSLSRAGAYAASVDDATAIYHNPAGLALADQVQLYAGFNLLDMNESYQREGTYSGTNEAYPKVSSAGPPLPIPFLAVNVPLGRLALAGGLFFPSGFAGGTFPDQVTMASGATRPAPQRYDMVSTDGLLAMPSVAAAYRVTDALTIGARFSAVWIESKAIAYGQVIPNAAENPQVDAKTTIDAVDPFTPQYGIGAHLALGSFELGAAYTSALHFDMKGTAKIEFSPQVMLNIEPVPDAQARCGRGGKVGALRACIGVTQFPQTAVIGGRWISRGSDGRERGDVELDVRWENWSADRVQTARIDGQGFGVKVPDQAVPTGFHDSWSFRIGGKRNLARDGSIVARAGIAYDTAPAPISWTRLTVNGASAFTFAGGFGMRFDRWRLDAGIAYVLSPTRIVHDYPLNADGTSVQPSIGTFANGTDPFNAGRYERSFVIGTVGATVWFGDPPHRRAPVVAPPVPEVEVAPPVVAAPEPAPEPEPEVAPALSADQVRDIVREELARDREKHKPRKRKRASP